MTEKRWEIIDEEFISYTGGTAQLISNGECEIHLWERPKDAQLFCDKLNAINEENEQLKTQLQNTSDQRDEFHRGARENANRVGKLEKENGQLRHDATILILSNQDYRKENEQLKQRNKRLEEKIQRERRVSAKQHLKWSKEAETKIKELSKENERLKKELLFFYDVANCECSTNWKEDMEKGCKRFFNCTYEEAKEKYGDYNGMWWEIND